MASAPPSSASSGLPSSASSGPASSSAGAAPPSGSPTAASPPPGVAALCPAAITVAALTTCLGGALGTFWSGQLNTTVSEAVVLNPQAALVPAPCRAGLKIAPAFTCPPNRTLYFTAAFVTKLDGMFPGALRSYAFAVVQAHEMGHIVQLAVHQPQIEDEHPSADDTRFIEQQADCLSGVWAHAATTQLGLDPARFRTAAQQVLTSISTDHEIATHGTPGQRLAAIDRGLQGARPQACSLATFH